MKRWGRTLRVGITVGLIFFAWYMRSFYRQNWKFKLFSADDWEYVWREFRSGWVIKAASDWVFVVTALLMIPVFLILWWVSVKISWRKSFMTLFRKIKNLFFRPSEKKVIKKKIKIKSKASHKKVRPRPMTSNGRPPMKQTGRTMDADKSMGVPVQPAFMSAAAAPAMSAVAEQQPQPREESQPVFLDEATSNIPLDEIKLPERIRLEEDLVAVLIAANYQVLTDVTLGKVALNYIGVSADKVVLCLTDTEKGDWLADEEFFNEEEPLWFSETSHRTSPVYRLLTEAKLFAKKMTDNGLTQTIVPILIEKEGTIVNANDMMETWKKMSMTVCRTDLGGPEELPSFAEALLTAADKGTQTDLDRVRDLL